VTGTVTSDNAANMFKAFEKPENNKTAAADESSTDEEEEQSKITNTDDQMWDDIDLSDDEDMESDFLEGLKSWATTVLPRRPCHSHLLQLGVNNALTKNVFVKTICSKLNNIVSYFRRSTHAYSQLRGKTGGLGLVRPCSTRWNSMYHTLKRVSRASNKASIK
jgi:hypothetical protein